MPYFFLPKVTHVNGHGIFVDNLEKKKKNLYPVRYCVECLHARTRILSTGEEPVLYIQENLLHNAIVNRTSSYGVPQDWVVLNLNTITLYI